MTTNKTFPIWIQGNNVITQGSGYTSNVSLRNDGKTELRGDVFITNSGKLVIGKDKNTTTNYDIDVQNDVNCSSSIYCNSLRGIGTMVLGNPLNSTTNLLNTLYIGSPNPFNENSLNPSSGLTSINIQAKRNGVVNIGSQSSNNNMDINLQSGQSKIQIGNGATGFTGIINIGSQTTGYTNTINIANSGTIANILNLGSTVSNVNITGQLICNSFLPSTTIISGFGNSNFITKLYADGIYQTIAGSSSYINSSTLTSTLLNYVLSSSLTTTLNNYYTKTNIDTNFFNKSADLVVSNLIKYNNSYLNTCSPDNFFNTTPYTLSSPFYDYYFIDRTSLNNTITINLPNAGLFGIGKQLNFICPISQSGINTTVIFTLTNSNLCFDYNSTAANSNNIILSKNSNYIQFTVFSSTTWIITSCNETISNLVNNYLPNTYITITDASLNYVTFFYLANTLLNYVTISSLNSTLANYTTNSNLTTNYVSNTSLNSTLANYSTLTNLTANYVSKNSLATSISTSSLNVLGVSVYNNELQLKNTAYNSGTKYWRFFQTSTGAAYLFNVTTDIGVFINFNSTSWSANSDRRIKKNINYLSTELNKINQLKPCYYNYNQDDVDVLPRIGFIAQDVQNVYKNLVSQGSYSEELQDNILGVDMSSMIPYIIKAIQEIDSKIENLVIETQDKKIADLENQISILNLRLSDALKTNNDSLEAKLTSLINMLSLKGIIDKKKL